MKELVRYLPQNNNEKPPEVEVEEVDDYRPNMTDIIPFDSIRPYDVRVIIEEVVDENSFFEIHKQFAKNIVVGFAKVKGKTVG